MFARGTYPSREEAEAIVWAAGVYSRAEMWALVWAPDSIGPRVSSADRLVVSLCSALLGADGWTPAGLREPNPPAPWRKREPGDDGVDDEGLVPLGDLLDAIRLGLVTIDRDPSPPQDDAEEDEPDIAYEDAIEETRHRRLQVIVELGKHVNDEIREWEERIALMLALDIPEDLPAARNKLAGLQKERDALRREWRATKGSA